MDAPISPSGLDLLIKEWIWLSRDFRNQLSKLLHSRNSSPAVFTSLGLLSGSSPKHLNPAPPKSVAYRASPHKDWEHGKHTQPQPSKGKTDLRTVINSRRLREMVLTPKGSGQWGLPPRSRAVNTSFYGARLSSTSSGAGLPTLPPCVPQGAAVSGEHISQGPPRNVVACGMPAPSEEGFRAVSSDASCRFAVSGRRSDCTTRQSVAYRASPPKNGDTGSVLNRSHQSVKRIWGPLLFLRQRQKKKKKRLDARGLRSMRTPPRSGAVNTSFYSVRLPPVSSGDRSANPATSCASGRSGLRRAHISRSTRKRSGLGMPAPSEEGFRAVSSDASCRFAVSERRSDCTTTYKSRNQSREAGTSSRILTAWKLLPNISRWVLQIIENGGVFHQGGPPAGSGNGTGNKSSVRERGHRICTSLQQGNRVLQPVFHSSK